MTTALLERELHSLGRRLNAWRAGLVGSWLAAGVLGTLFLATLLDLLLRWERPGRVSAWLLVVAAGAVLIWRVAVELRRRRSPEGVAARVEAAHPELDSRLINVLQFGRAPEPGVLVEAYLRDQTPAWSQIDPARLKDHRAHRRASLTAAGAALLLALPLTWHAAAWSNALLRVLNPFSDRAPSTLAEILMVKPGDTQVLNAAPVVLTAEVRGKPGQPVSVEIKPNDDVSRHQSLGDLRGGAEAETFAHDLPRVTGSFQYRFRAGDARSGWHRVDVVPPLAVTMCEGTAAAPPHTGWESGPCLPLVETVRLPEGTRVDLRAGFNRPPVSAGVRIGEVTHPLQAAGNTPGVLLGQVELKAGARAKLVAEDATGSKLEVELGFEVIPDAAPRIQVLSPTGRGALRAGERPRIEFKIADDFGLGEIRLERVAPDAEAGAAGTVLQTWPAETRREFSASWSQALSMEEAAVSFRLVAVDNAPAAHTNRSPLITFDNLAAEDPLAALRKAAVEAQATLAKLVDLQKKNLAATAALHTSAEPRRDLWQSATGKQEEIKTLAGGLLGKAGEPLGTLTPVLRELHGGAMTEVIDVLRRAAQAEGAARAPLAGRAVMLEERILRVLTRVDENFEAAADNRQKTGLLALLDKMVKEQASVMERTKAFDTLPASQKSGLVERQDALSADVPPFLTAARKESEELKRNDPGFSEIVIRAAEVLEKAGVQAEMLRAAENLEKPDAAAAMINQAKVLTALQEAQTLINAWRAATGKKEMAEALEAIEEAKEKFQKLADMKARVNEAQRELKKGKDLSDKEMEQMEEEIGEMNARIEAAAMQIATDLHIFPDLPVGNDLVEDVFTVYEEAKQVAGSEKEAASELGLQKEDWILDALAAKTERLDGMEMWLEAKPDATKRLTENFDAQEMPQIPVIPMATEFEDIIGDLLEQQEEIEKQTDDSATNQGSSDLAEGWGIAEGEFTSYAAKGKSGNMRPDHNEQTGRSLVGREGQANGETAAGVGKINEGDKNIENRRTQDPSQSGQVQLEGHNDAKATGGGKLGGHDDEFGDSGAGPRRDAQSKGNEMGMQASLRKRAEELYAKATLGHVRTGDLDEAVLNMGRAEEAMRKGYPITQVREWQRRAAAALKRTQAGLEGETYAGNLRLEEQPAGLDPAFATSPDDAPAEYRDLVSEYFKSLGGAGESAAP